jgi:hypothetical protein
MTEALRPPKRICVDFDGTLCDHEFPKIGKVKPGAREALAKFKELGYIIVIWSCRTCGWDKEIFNHPYEYHYQPLDRQCVKEMVDWLAKEQIPYDIIDDSSKGKPVADFYIDDKALCFKDNWALIQDAITLYSKE